MTDPPKEKKSLLAVVERVLALIATITTILGFLITVTPLKSCSPVVDARVKVANAVAPKDFMVLPRDLQVIPWNSEFSLQRGESVLLTPEKRIPTTLNDSYYPADGSATLVLDGKKEEVMRGGKIPIGDSGGFLWLHKVEPQGRAHFEIRKD